jgi:8-oxo-dGTP pyrophosphatase MutT (NUDIX family)
VIQYKQQQGTPNDDTILHLIREKLNGDGLSMDWRVLNRQKKTRGSAVMFLLSRHRFDGQNDLEPCLVLNKRSQRVLQPGDLCCPGGGVEPLDRLLSQMLRWPFSPLFRWPPWRHWQDKDPQLARGLSLMFGTGLREAWEEMHLNPLRVTFLGPLQVQRLIMFKRSIYPLACWVPSIDGLQPNWEVERIVLIPLRQLMQAHRYGRYRLRFVADGVETQRKEDFPFYPPGTPWQGGALGGNLPNYHGFPQTCLQLQAPRPGYGTGRSGTTRSNLHERLDNGQFT